MASLDDIQRMTEQILAAVRTQQDDIPLTRQQAAYYIGKTPTSIDNYIRKGVLKKAVKHGLVGYLRTDLDKLK